MLVIKKNKVLFIDVDNTLIIWESGDKWHPHKAHIALLEQFKLQGHGVVVWSAGGWKWASRAIKMLGIEHLVDYAINKPDWWADDLSSNSILTQETKIFLDDADKIE